MNYYLAISNCHIKDAEQAACEKFISIKMSLVGTGMLNISLTLIALQQSEEQKRVYNISFSIMQHPEAERSVKVPKEEAWHTAVRV